MFTRYRPNTIDDVLIDLDGVDPNMKVEIGPGVPLVAKTVAELCALSTWPPGLVLIIPRERNRESVVKVERA